MNNNYNYCYCQLINNCGYYKLIVIDNCELEIIKRWIHKRIEPCQLCSRKI